MAETDFMHANQLIGKHEKQIEKCITTYNGVVHVGQYSSIYKIVSRVCTWVHIMPLSSCLIYKSHRSRLFYPLVEACLRTIDTYLSYAMVRCDAMQLHVYIMRIITDDRKRNIMLIKWESNVTCWRYMGTGLISVFNSRWLVNQSHCY